MATIDTDEDRIEQVWNLCCEVYAKHGRILSFPAGTNPHKTYQWRYLKKLTQKIEEWDFDNETSKILLDIAVGYIKEKGLLHKGLAALLQSNMLEVCHDRLKKQQNNNSQSIRSLEHVHHWLRSLTKGEDLYPILMNRKDRYSLRNITIWYQSSKLSRLYLALSKSCCKALVSLATINPHERSLLPKSLELYSIRQRFIKDSTNESLGKKILQDDWRT